MVETVLEKKARAMREWRQKNPERARALKQKWVSENKEKHQASQRNAALKMRYGITLDRYNEMLDQQNNRCAICGVESGEGRNRLIVDHCHNSGSVRKLLCQPCNAVLGMSFEKIETLQSAINYLSSFKGYK